MDGTFPTAKKLVPQILKFWTPVPQKPSELSSERLGDIWMLTGLFSSPCNLPAY
jgi:hypothetical protein